MKKIIILSLIVFVSFAKKSSAQRAKILLDPTSLSMAYAMDHTSFPGVVRINPLWIWPYVNYAVAPKYHMRQRFKRMNLLHNSRSRSRRGCR